jgi:hypothetical protein
MRNFLPIKLFNEIDLNNVFNVYFKLIMCSMFILIFLINFLPIKLFNDIDVNIVFIVLYFIIGS